MEETSFPKVGTGVAPQELGEEGQVQGRRSLE